MNDSDSQMNTHHNATIISREENDDLGYSRKKEMVKNYLVAYTFKALQT